MNHKVRLLDKRQSIDYGYILHLLHPSDVSNLLGEVENREWFWAICSS